MRLRLAEMATNIADSVMPPDPGSLRRMAALRATLSGLLSFLLVMLLGLVTPVPHPDRILAFGIALFTGATVRDRTPRQRAVTMALAVGAAFAAIAVASLLAADELASGLAITVVAFAATYGAQWGPRWGALGLIGLIAFLIGLVTREPPETLPLRLLVLCLAVASTALIRLLLLPEDPGSELNRLRRDIRLGMSRVLGAIEAGLSRGAWNRPALRRVQRQLERLTAMMLMAQTRVAAMASPPPGLGLHLLDVELATERVARLAHHNLGPGADRGALCATLADVRQALAADRLPPKLADSPVPLGHALAVLARLIGRDPDSDLSTAAPPASPMVSGIRPAAQAAVAVLLAVALGHLISPNRWYWAAFAAFVTFQGTRSRGESIRKAAQFMTGTLAGVIVGVLVAVLLSGHDIVSVITIVIAVFFAFQAFQAAYAVMVFWITIILGLMFGLFGFFPPELLLLRFKETAVGAGAGLLVACLLMVRPTGAVVDAAFVAMCRAIGATVTAATRSLLGTTPDPELPGALVGLESRFAEMREAARPELAGFGAERHRSLRRRMVILSACHSWGRELGRIALHVAGPNDPKLDDMLRAIAARIDATVAHLAGGSPESGQSPGQVPDASGPATQPPLVSDHDSPAERAVHLLVRIDLALRHLASSTP